MDLEEMTKDLAEESCTYHDYDKSLEQGIPCEIHAQDHQKNKSFYIFAGMLFLISCFFTILYTSLTWNNANHGLNVNNKNKTEFNLNLTILLLYIFDLLFVFVFIMGFKFHNNRIVMRPKFTSPVHMIMAFLVIIVSGLAIANITVKRDKKGSNLGIVSVSFTTFSLFAISSIGIFFLFGFFGW